MSSCTFPTGGAIPCPPVIERAPVIIFGGPDAVSPVGRERSILPNGIEALVSKTTMRAGTLDDVPLYMTEEVVRFPGETVWLDIRVPGWVSSTSWSVVDEAVATVRPSKGSTVLTQEEAGRLNRAQRLM